MKHRHEKQLKLLKIALYMCYESTKNIWYPIVLCFD